MLLRFEVENYRSIKDKQELSLVASSLDDATTGLISSGAFSSGHLLPAVVIYGANASGKSNVISAFQSMQSAVLYSHNRRDPGTPLGIYPFLLTPGRRNDQSIFSVDFILDGVRYHYGFETTKNAYVAEWLFGYPNDKRQSWFERRGKEFFFGRNLKGQNKVISELVREDSLFLSTATQNSHEQLSKVSEFFKSIEIEATRPHTGIIDKDEIDKRAISFLDAVGAGVVSYEIVQREKSELDIYDSLREWFRTTIFKELDSKSPGLDLFNSAMAKPYKISLGHRGADENIVYLEFNLESDGTKRLLLLLSDIFQALDKGTVLIIDELNASLHTQACEALIGLFSLPETNPHGAQLIATTHDTNLLRSPVLRRDQVWFTEKDHEGATHLYPLTDIRTRKGDNLERGYLQGRYGAVPFSGSVKEIISGI
jgi:AAA15 family ATPase/GTPase